MRVLENLQTPERAQNCSKVYFQGISNQVSVKMKILSFCHGSRASSPLPGFIVFFIIYVRKMESAKFTVIGPRDPVTAILGQETVLPCHLSPGMSAANMEVRWFRPEFLSFVHLYRDGKDQFDRQMPEYQGRTELLKAGLTDGNVPLRIFNIRHSDEGQYHCFVQDDTFHEETILELQVAGLGSAPLISVEGHQDGGIRVVCRSAGWYPEPEVLWKDLNGRHLPSLSEIKSPGDNNLFETETVIIVTEHANRNLSCCIRNTVLDQEKESAVYIADPFFPRVNSWMVSLSVILVVLFGFIGLTVYLFKMKGKLTEEVGKQDLEIGKRDIEIDKRDKEINLRDKEINKQDIEIEKRDKEISKLHTEIDKRDNEIRWRRSVAPIENVNVTLDPDTTHPELVLSEDQKSVRRGDRRQDLPDNPERFDTWGCVLGSEGFTSGRHCWEVEVGDGRFWAVGVARESVGRKGWINRSPEGGIWAVGQWGDQFQALTSPETLLPLSRAPSKIRVCLDCDWGQVIFIDAGDGAPIFTFPPGSVPGERIQPWFQVGYQSRLCLCP
ncbi:butyrophilin subfamily 1 member A1-like [Gopherus evgoodei]|uniref:butyrophilin subfamily 1 member A1-like n=1 Tax=Gopherus evgoodei TaxID=1825980 RepID=UPI0011CFB59B|nr:butyrophilin subfamily 1 member A1-like [Gopherus evgoodei]